MRLPHWLYLYWIRRIYRRSPAWQETREYVLKHSGRHCHYLGCHIKHPLEVHHINYDGLPEPKLWHFLPFACFLIHGVDRVSEMTPLCHAHHRLVT